MSQPYVGTELELFARAVHWKAYLAHCFRPHLRGSVLEVGAGNGVNAASFLPHLPEVKRWVSLEPDENLYRQILARGIAEAHCATLADLPGEERFGAILYVDVLEHIADDTAEMRRAEARLEPGGRLVVLSPAHSFLFSPFDAAIGHFRRYNRKSLAEVMPKSLRCRELYYLDSVGFFASLANRCLLRQGAPTVGQIHLWDRVFVRASRLLDPCLGYRFGKTVVGVWEKSAPGTV